MGGDSFYWNGGSKRPSVLWEELGIRHWLAFGNDDTISAKYEALLADGFIDTGSGKLVLPKVSRKVEDMWDKNFLNDLKAEILIIEDPGKLPPSFCHYDNLAALSGYRSDDPNIKPVKPAGFFAPDFIFNRVTKNIIGYNEGRVAHLSFRGVRSTRIEGKGSSQLTGFYQQNLAADHQIQAVARNKESAEIGRAAINPDAGLFKMSLSEPAINGIIQIEDQGVVKFSKSFTLLQGVRGSVNIVEKTFTDAYGREFQLIGNEINRPDKIRPYSWYGPYYSDEKAADIKLSDMFRELFVFLGPTVMIADPYFLGPLRKDETTDAVTLSRCQTAFLSAMLRSLVDGTIKELLILGFNTRANQVEGKDEATSISKKENRFKGYEILLGGIFGSKQLQAYKKDFRIEFFNNSRDFHNRYWFGIKDKDGVRILDRGVAVTNSIGNIFEVDFFTIEEPEQLRELTTRYLSFINSADSELIV